MPQTVSSVKVGTLRGPLHGAQGGAVVTIADVPGHAQLSRELLNRAASAAGIVFVVDASAPYDSTAKVDHFKAASVCVCGPSSPSS